VVFDPLEAVGLVATGTPRNFTVLGSCFRFRHEHLALTAAHCVTATGTVFLLFPRSGRIQTVLTAERHPTADVALLITAKQSGDTGEGYPTRAFWDRVSNWGLGEEFVAYGFPVEGPYPDGLAGTPVPRLFVGHYQRFFEFASPSGNRYLAGEMSIPAPAGLSGSPLFRRAAPEMVTGLVTTNLESYAVTDSVVEVDARGTKYREEARKVISYGIALMLSGVTDWLRDVVPVRGGLGWVS
jgi:Trypsin-like peptidase domain